MSAIILPPPQQCRQAQSRPRLGRGQEQLCKAESCAVQREEEGAPIPSRKYKAGLPMPRRQLSAEGDCLKSGVRSDVQARTVRAAPLGASRRRKAGCTNGLRQRGRPGTERRTVRAGAPRLRQSPAEDLQELRELAARWGRAL